MNKTFAISHAGLLVGIQVFMSASIMASDGQCPPSGNYTIDSSVIDSTERQMDEKWNYKWEKDSDTPHIGPMAQDFKAAFYPGADDKSITTLEFDGVELAAIQGLYQVIKEKAAQISELRRELIELKATVQKVSKRVEQLNAAPHPAANVHEQGGM